MNKKGFTLVELLAIIILLSFVAVFAFPKLVEIFQNKQDEIDSETLKLIYGGASEYIKNNDDYFPNDIGNTYCVNITKLKDDKLVPIDVDKYKNKAVEVKVGKNKNSYKIIDECDSGIVVRLVNAKFSDNTTSKTFQPGEEVEIFAVLPDNHFGYANDAPCFSSSDIGRIRTKIQYEYSLKGWNVDDTTNTSIMYQVPDENSIVKAVVSEKVTEVGRYKCSNADALYSEEHYSCPNGGSLSSTTCTITSTTGLITYKYQGTCRDCIGGDYVGCHWEDYPCEKTDTTCPNEYHKSGSVCVKNTTYTATFNEAYYYCNTGELNGQTCYFDTEVD